MTAPVSRIGIAMRRRPDYSTAKVVRSDVSMAPASKASVQRAEVPWRESRVDSSKNVIVLAVKYRQHHRVTCTIAR